VVASRARPPHAAAPSPPPTPIPASSQIDGKACSHQVAWPPGDPRAGAPGASAPPPTHPGPPAKTYPFPLDPFQSTAIAALEAGASVMVAAHTSAGKTVVAEYCAAMALRGGARCVYTSPLKALSNQKYRELAAEFGQVGLLTGDATINPDAPVLVMTTEILRSMLYASSPVVTEASLLIFDEVHYLRDRERGVVWEECVALAPRAARFAFLSATLPNAAEFAAWVASVHGAPVHVVHTDHRPTPLVQYVFPAGGTGLHLVVDERNGFREAAFARALADLDAAGADGDGGKAKAGAGAAPSAPSSAAGDAAAADIQKLVKMVVDRGYDPAIVFSFSKRECEAHGAATAAVDLNTPAEAALVDKVYAAATACLTAEDRALPQVAGLPAMLRRGVGVHHAGLLPLLKETVEVLFQEGLLKVLFATETFSTGLNMPAKTVVFTGARKFDGGAFRALTAGEYVQMAGRAGRRGLDARGVVVLMLDARLDAGVARGMLKGGGDPLTSAFRLSYSGLLTMARAADASPESLINASFCQYQARAALPALREAADEAAATAAAAASAVDDAATVAAYADGRAARAAAARAARDAALTPRAVAPFLQPGRVVLLGCGSTAGGAPPAGPAPPAAAWGAIVGFERVRGGGTKADPDDLLVDVVARWAGTGGETATALAPAAGGADADAGTPSVLTLPLARIDALSSVRVRVASDMRPASAREAAVDALCEVSRRFGGEAGGVPLLDPVADLGTTSAAYDKAVARVAALDASLAAHPLARADDAAGRLASLAASRAAAADAEAAATALAVASAPVLAGELEARRRVLRKLGAVDAAGLVTLKGRVAAELASAGGDELALAEVVFSGGLAGVRADALAALLACVAWREPPSPRAPATAPDGVDASLAALRAAARRVAVLEHDVGLAGGREPDDAATAFPPSAAAAVLLWARGARFVDALKACDAFEGSLVRVLRRVEELLRQLGAAAGVLGDAALARAAADAGAKIKRGVPFAPSLYL